MKLSFQNILEESQGTFVGQNPNVTIEHISIDSRSLQNGATTLFFALKGQNHDAHSYLKELIEKGVHYFVVNQIPDELHGKANFLVVKNTLETLQKIAAYYRNQFNFPIIGITGSNGKTIVKEWLNFYLSPTKNVVRNPKSFNSQVGVPLSIFSIQGNPEIGIFEAGISLPNEMQKLEEILQPKYGILTNIGTNHDEGFENEIEKIQEKIKLFKNCEAIFLERNEAIENLLPKEKQVLTWSFTDKNATVFVTNEIQNSHTNLKFSTHENDIEVIIPFTDSNSIENAITCICFLLFLKIDISYIQKRSEALYPVELRLQAKKGIHNCLVIDDSYSLDYPSLKIALDFLEQQKQFTKKTVILSDFFSGGIALDSFYKNVKELLQSNYIERIITIGETSSLYLKELPNVIAFSSTHDFLSQFNTQSFQNETILVKGNRSFSFKEIVVLLEEKNHETVLEINLDALTHNLNFYKSKLKPETKTMVMVKAFGYGNGGYELAKQLEHHKVAYLGVAFADEGIELRKAGIKTPIMVLNPENSSFAAMIAYNLEPEIYSISGLKAFLKVGQTQNISNYPIHIKVDTGMHRLGFESHTLNELISLLRNNNLVTIKSVFSHLAATDDAQFEIFTKKQMNRFEAFYETFSTELQVSPIRHILNTSGIFNYPEKQYEMVRLGIGLYGIGNSDIETSQLQNVSTLKSIISQIRTVLPEESIGYSRKYMVEKPIKVATIPIGYADGIRRAWGNEKGFVYINRKKAIILGNVCMDMLMVDISEINCQEGDEVVIFGENPTVIEMAKVLQTIPYEILTGISHRVKRIFFKN